MKRILVTGGAGFIGSHLCDKLISEGNEIICLDNFFTGMKKNIAHLLNNHNFELLRQDITESKLYEVDQIYNLACPASPMHYQLDPIQTTRTNVLGALNVLENAKRLKIPILQASTSEIYGDPTIHPQTEDYFGNVNCIGPRSCYDEGKRCAETLFFDYYKQHGVDIKVTRIFNTYGPKMNQNDGRVVANFIMQALQNNDITICGDGSQTRSFCYISDLVTGLYKMMNSDASIIGPINLGNPIECTIKELAEKIVVLTKSKSKLVYIDLPQDDPTRRKPDITNAKKLLNWEPYVDIDSGLLKTIAYFKKILCL